jgi:hypothetical protein
VKICKIWRGEVEATKINGWNKINKAINLISFVIGTFIIQILSSNFQLFKSLITNELIQFCDNGLFIGSKILKIKTACCLTLKNSSNGFCGYNWTHQSVKKKNLKAHQLIPMGSVRSLSQVMESIKIPSQHQSVRFNL